MTKINPLQAFALMVNRARSLATMFPTYFQEASSKRNIYPDFGYPKSITLEQFRTMYARHALAHAAVGRTVLKVWQDNPAFVVGKEEHNETTSEASLAEHLNDIHFWRACSEADKRAMVCGWSGLILHYADSKQLSDPVEGVPGLFKGLADATPVWATQVEVTRWDENQDSETYGEPLEYQFSEGNVGDHAGRKLTIHRDRMLIWSTDGTMAPKSDLQPGFNSLIDIEKITGAGGEGFWKNAKSSPYLQVDKDASLESMASAMGVESDKLTEAIDTQIDEFNKGFDASLILQGMEAKTIPVSLPQPREFLEGPLQLFAASFGIPLKVLLGSQTGERASTEDAREWALTCMSRRNTVIKPMLRQIINRLSDAKVLPAGDWRVKWSDLTETSASERIDRASKMAEITQKMMLAGADDLAFDVEAIREAAGMKTE